MKLKYHKEHDHHHHECDEESVTSSVNYPWHIFYSPSLNIKNSDLSGFNTLILTLNARQDSDLKWNSVLEIAQEAKSRGLYILWDLDLGLFETLFDFNEGLFASYEIAIKHFLKEIYPLYKAQTVGLLLYKGALDFLTYPVIEQAVLEEHRIQGQFEKKIIARDIAIDYLNQLASLLPDEIQSFIWLKQHDLSSYETAVLASKEYLSLYHVILEGSDNACYSDTIGVNKFAEKGFVAEKLVSTFYNQPKIAILLPNSEQLLQKSSASFFPLEILGLSGRTVKIISEMFLTHDWGGVDYLIVDSSFTTPQTKRKLLGFIAAGGVIVTQGELLGLPEEISWDEFLDAKTA